MSVKLGHRAVKMFLDTLSDVSACSLDYYTKNIKYFDKSSATNVSDNKDTIIEGVGGTARVHISIDTRLQIGPTNLVVTFLIIEGLPVDCLISHSVIRQFKSDLLLATNRACIS
jgi:hypothetical protein